MAKDFYVVLRGRNRGIFKNYYAVEASINGYPGASQRGFNSFFDALRFLDSQKPQIEYSHLYATIAGSFDYSVGAAFGLILKDGSNQFPYASIIDSTELSACRHYAGEMAGALVAAKKAIEFGATELTIYYSRKIVETCAFPTAKTHTEGTTTYKKSMVNYKNTIRINFDGNGSSKDAESASLLAEKAICKRWLYIPSENYLNIPDMSAIWEKTG